jgi:hypothetical protein
MRARPFYERLVWASGEAGVIVGKSRKVLKKQSLTDSFSYVELKRNSKRRRRGTII